MTAVARAVDKCQFERKRSVKIVHCPCGLQRGLPHLTREPSLQSGTEGQRQWGEVGHRHYKGRRGRVVRPTLADDAAPQAHVTHLFGPAHFLSAFRSLALKDPALLFELLTEILLNLVERSPRPTCPLPPPRLFHAYGWGCPSKTPRCPSSTSAQILRERFAEFSELTRIDLRDREHDHEEREHQRDEVGVADEPPLQVDMLLVFFLASHGYTKAMAQTRRVFPVC